MIDRTHELPVKRQAELMGISRGTVYYHPEPVSEAELAAASYANTCAVFRIAP